MSFEIDCFYNLWTQTYEYAPPPFPITDPWIGLDLNRTSTFVSWTFLLQIFSLHSFLSVFGTIQKSYPTFVPAPGVKDTSLPFDIRQITNQTTPWRPHQRPTVNYEKHYDDFCFTTTLTATFRARPNFVENVRGGGKIFRGGSTIISPSQKRAKIKKYLTFTTFI